MVMGRPERPMRGSGLSAIGPRSGMAPSVTSCCGPALLCPIGHYEPLLSEAHCSAVTTASPICAVSTFVVPSM
jgi:hypothetical protein